MVHCEGSGGGGAASTGATATGSGAATVPVASNLRLLQRDQPLGLLWGHSMNMHVSHHFRTPVAAGPSIHPAASTWHLSHFLGIVGTRGGGGGGAPFLKRCAPFYLFFAPSYWFCAPPKGKFPWKLPLVAVSARLDLTTTSHLPMKPSTSPAKTPPWRGNLARGRQISLAAVSPAGGLSFYPALEAPTALPVNWKPPETSGEASSSLTGPSELGQGLPTASACVPRSSQETEGSCKRAASESPSPPSSEGGDFLEDATDFLKIFTGLVEGELTLDVLVKDMQQAMLSTQGGLQKSSRQSFAHTLKAEALKVGETRVAEELGHIITNSRPGHELPKWEAYARLWMKEHDHDDEVKLLRKRQCALALSVIMGLTTFLEVLPPNTRSEWCMLTTSMLVIDDDHGDETPRVKEHALNMYALQPHDFCLSELHQVDWDARKPTDGTDAEHTMLRSTDGYLRTWQGSVTLQAELLVRKSLESHGWKMDSNDLRREARHHVWRMAHSTSMVMGLYYLDPRVAIKVVGSSMGSGLHAHNWFKLERQYALIPIEYMQSKEMTMNFDDMDPLCVYNSSIGNKGVNTGNMDEWLKFGIKEYFVETEEGIESVADPRVTREWRDFAKKRGFAASKKELLSKLKCFHTLREFAMSPPWYPVPTIGDHTGEDYNINPFHEAHLRYGRQDFFAPLGALEAHQAVPDGGTWLGLMDTQKTVVDTLFTANATRGHLHGPRGLILGASSPTYAAAQTNKMWVFSIKFKPGEAGHFMRKWPLIESTHEECRQEWGETLGLLGVMALARHRLCASKVFENGPLATVVETLGVLRSKTTKPGQQAYGHLMDKFPVKLHMDQRHRKKNPFVEGDERLLGNLVLRDLMALSLHGKIPSLEDPGRDLKLASDSGSDSGSDD